MKHTEESGRTLVPSERRELVKRGVKAGKSRRRLAAELGVTDQTIRRDLEALGIKGHKKPTITKRTKATDSEVVSHEPSGKRALKTEGSKPQRETPTAAKKDGKRKIVIPRMPESQRQRLNPSPEEQRQPLDPSPEESRQDSVKEMVQLVRSWLVEREEDYSRDIDVLDKTRNRLNGRSHSYFHGIPESSMSAAELRDQTRPQEMDSARPKARREEVCVQWLAGWLAAWAPRDERLRNEVFTEARKLAQAPGKQEPTVLRHHFLRI